MHKLCDALLSHAKRREFSALADELHSQLNVLTISTRTKCFLVLSTRSWRNLPRFSGKRLRYDIRPFVEQFLRNALTPTRQWNATAARENWFERVWTTKREINCLPFHLVGVLLYHRVNFTDIFVAKTTGGRGLNSKHRSVDRRLLCKSKDASFW